MDTIVQVAIDHGYWFLFAALFVHQLGLPLPGPLFLIAGGAMAATGKFSFFAVVILAALASVLADWPWFEAGRKRGDRVLHFLHRLTRDPEYHDRRAKELFGRYGNAVLLVSKFVPGLDAVIPPLAGTARTSRIRFLAFDTAGATLYALAYTGLGHLFSHDLNRAVVYAGRTGTVLACIAFFTLITYAGWNLLQRYRLTRSNPDTATTSAIPPESLGSAAKPYAKIEGLQNGN